MRRNPGFARQLRRYYGIYTLGFALFVVLLAIGESLGLSQQLIGHVFLFVTIAIYATIGVLSRTSDVTEYYVAGRRVPALFNGMATAADWMSAASFIGTAGVLYLQGFDGLAYILGWTGGYCLVAILLAPYLRRFGQFTIPDFLGARYGGQAVRLIAVAATVLVSPVGTRRWALSLETSLSHNIAYSQGRALGEGRELPGSSNWVGLGVASEWRPSRSLLLRVAAGRSWLLDTSGYGVLRQRELSEAEQAIGFLPGVTAVDAARAAMAGETLGVWYVHIDIAPSWRW